MAVDDALRKEVSRLRSLVTKKVYRVKKNSGAHVGGTRFDPRPKIPVTRMNETQLTAYASKFKEFLQRDAHHQFVPGYSRSVITRATFQEYKAAEARANQTKDSLLRRYDNIELPGASAGTTVAEHKAKLSAGFRRMTDDATYRPSLMHRDSQKIDGEAAARKLIEQQKNQSDAAWFAKKIEQGRENYATMMTMMGKPDLAHDIDALTDDQMGLLLFGTDFMHDTSLKYLASQKQIETGKRRKGIDDAIDEAFSEHDMWIEWAASQKF